MDTAIKCGLLGEKLTHSYSPILHGMLAEYSYSLFEKSTNELEDFIRNGDFKGMNVTIPYKKAVYSLMDEVSDSAMSTRSVNTVLRRDDGSLFGDNTDVYGFSETVRRSGICVRGKKILVLGSGGASAAVCCALRQMGSDPIVISRSGVNNYENISEHFDSDIIINTTPLGMYPNNGTSPLDLTLFGKLCAVFDLVYNPAKTALLMQAEKMGITAVNGLYMLVSQAKRSSEIFTGKIIDNDVISDIFKKLSLNEKNIILIGMPGCGKTTVACELAAITGRNKIDSDEEFTKLFGMMPSAYIKKHGEADFRSKETELLKNLGKLSGYVISTGGGAVTREENYDLLHQNGIVVWLQRKLTLLSVSDRPLSAEIGVESLYKSRKSSYERFADVISDNSGTLRNAAEDILRKVSEYNENSCDKWAQY